MKGYIICLVFVFLVGWVADAAAEEKSAARQEETLFPECPVPEMKENDDFFKVNPSLREQYYEYHRSLARLDKDIYGVNGGVFNTSVNYIVLAAKFRLFVEDFLNNNRKLLHHARRLYRELQEPSRDMRRTAYRDMFKEVQKYASRLAGKVDFLIPGSLAKARDGALEDNFKKEIRSQSTAALIGLLFLRMETLQDEIGHFFFPDRFTVSYEELNGQSTPLHPLNEIAFLAEELANRFPERGLPEDLAAPPWLSQNSHD
ncbi:MAG: hypothetical protein JXQ27_01890 [Acidobacteria bacterium]|nr:hypothetical protein [Acidobacteriota bacterium]